MANKYLEMINRAVDRVVADGYEFVGKGMGDYRPLEKTYRDRGYLTYGAFTVMSRDMSKRQWVLYARPRKNNSGARVTTPDYSTMTSKQLKDLCKDRKVSGYSKMTKDQMIKALAS